MGPINVDHDRRTRMIDSSVNASMKKGGGGGYNWGSTMDVTDYEPVSAESEPMVSVGPCVEESAGQKSWSRRRYTNNLDKFPDLSAVTAFLNEGTERPAISWGPGMNPKPPCTRAETGTESCRLSTVSFDAQHPRNQFSRGPRKARSRTSSTDSHMSVDWSAEGADMVRKEMIMFATNSSHPALGSCEKEHHVTPLQILKSLPGHKRPVQIKPKSDKNAMSRKPDCTKRPCVTQARAR